MVPYLLPAINRDTYLLPAIQTARATFWNMRFCISHVQNDSCMRPLTCHALWSYKQLKAHRQCNGTESVTVVPSTAVWR